MGDASPYKFTPIATHDDTTCKQVILSKNVGNAGDDAFGALSHLPEVDGLRAVAIIPVVLYHFGLSCPGGYTGVDVFFIISGFLITSILLPDLSMGSLSLLNFWTRRVRRLFPALAVMLIAVLCAGNFIFLSTTYSSLAKETWMVLLLMANFHFFGQSSYLTTKHEQPLLHCWSLAVEEQFYLAYPCALWLSWELGRSRGVVCMLLMTCFASLSLSIIATPSNTNFAFYLLPTRAWELALGGILALNRSCSLCKIKIVAELGGWAGLTMIITSYLMYNDRTPYPGYHALLPCVGASLFITSQGSSRTSCGNLLAMDLPVFIGRISYSWYLWHWPAFVFLSFSFAGEKLETKWTIIGITSSLFAAIFSYLCIEPTFRSQKKVPNKVLYPIVALTWFVLCFTSWCLMSGDIGGVHGVSQAMHLQSKNITANQIVYIKKKSSNRDKDYSYHGQGKQVLPVKGQHASRGQRDYSDLSNRSIHQPNGTHIRQDQSSDSVGHLDGNVEPQSHSNLKVTVKVDPSPETCLVYLSDAEVDSLYSVNAQDIHYGNVLQSPGFLSAKWEFWFFKKSQPYVLGQQAGREPSVAIIGTSHCEMYGWLLKQLAPQYDIEIAIMCSDGPMGFFQNPLNWWDVERLAFLDKWKLKLIVWIDFWAADTSPCTWFKAYDFSYAFNLLSSRAERLLVFGDTPQLPVPKSPGDDMLKMWVSNRYKEENSFTFLTSLYEDPDFRRCRLGVEANITAALKATLGHRGRFVETASYLRDESTQHLQLIDPEKGSLVYADYSHLNIDGAKRLEQLFRREIFNQAICDTSHLAVR